MSDLRGRIEGQYDSKALDNEFAFYKSKFWWKSPAARSGMWDGRTHLFNRHSGVFPLGLLRPIKKWLKVNGVPYKVVDLRDEPCPLPRRPISNKLGGGITLRKDQRRAVRRALRKERGVIHGSTGSGKTELAASIIKNLGVPVTLFLTGRKKLARQTRERFAKRLKVQVEDIGFIEAGRWNTGTTGVYVAVVDSLTADKFKSLRSDLYNRCQLLFIDEAHHAGSSSWYQTLMRCKARYRYGLTGTPIGRSDSGDLYLVACTGPVVSRIKAADLIESGVLAEPRIFFTPIRRPIIVGNDGGWAKVYQRAVVDNAHRNDVITDYTEELTKLDKRTLVLVKELRHGHALTEKLTSAAFIHGGTPAPDMDAAIKAFEAGEVRVLVATSVLDEGVDIPTINALVLASGGKSVITTLQRIGRGLRRKADDNRLWVFDFYDDTNEHLREHAKRRIETCETEGFKVTILDGPAKIAGLLK